MLHWLLARDCQQNVGNPVWSPKSRRQKKMMMKTKQSSFRQKVEEIFIDLAGPDRAKWLSASTPSRCMLQVADAVSAQSEYPEKIALDIGINVTDWQADAAFLVALHLFPERFSAEEIDEGVRSLLIHVPSHVLAAARLAGHPIDDLLTGADDDDEPPADAAAGGGTQKP